MRGLAHSEIAKRRPMSISLVPTGASRGTEVGAERTLTATAGPFIPDAWETEGYGLSTLKLSHYPDIAGARQRL